MLRGAIAAAALTLAYFVVVSIGTVTGIQDRAPERGPEIEAGTLQVGPFRVDMRCQAPCRGDEATVTARFRSAGMPNVRDISVVDMGGTAISMSGAARAPQAEIRAAPGDSLRLRLTTHDHDVYTAGFAMPAAQESTPPASPWPDTARGVWWVIAAFVIVTAGSILAWLWMVMRAFRFERQKQIAKAQRAAQPSPPPGATLPPGAS